MDVRPGVTRAGRVSGRLFLIFGGGIGIRFFLRARTVGRGFHISPSYPFLENVKIVLVEDKVDFCLMVAGFLNGQGAQGFTAEDGFEGLRLVRAISPDLVVTDVGMPGRSGLELLMDIRNLGPENGGNVPVVAISGYMLDSEVAAGGFQSILRKPFTPDQLLAAIDGVLSGKQE